MNSTIEKLERKILALLFHWEVLDRNINIENLVQEMLIGKYIITDILSGNVKHITSESLFSLNQQLYHRVGIPELVTNGNLLTLDEFGNIKDAMVAFFKQDRYKKRIRCKKSE